MTRTQRRLVLTVVAATAVGAAASGNHPTANRASDVVLTAAFAALIAAACSISRTWTWLVLAGIAAACSTGGWQLAGAAVEVVVLVAAVRDVPQRRLVGAVIGGVGVQVLLHLGAGPFFGSSALAVVVASAPVCWSAWMVAHGTTRTIVRRTVYVVGAVVVVATLSAAFSLVQARSSANQAIAHVRAGLDAARQGNTEQAGTELASAAVSFATARREASSWLTRPAEFVPVVGQQVASIDRLTTAGETASAAAAKATTEADVNALRLRSGRIDLTRVAAAAQPLTEVKAALADVQRAIAVSRSPWLVRPLATRIDAVAVEVDRAARDADVASQAVAVAPSLLGGNGPRRYFVAFANPAEPRDLGGFVGGYGELVVDNGHLQLVHTGRASDLNAGGPHALPNPSALPIRYRGLQLDRFWQNITGSPDFPTVAAAVQQLWPESGGAPIDGVLYVDPYALAALLRLTGPVTVPGIPTTLSADNIVQFLTVDQYTQLSVDDDRHDLLSDTAKVVFDKLTSTDLPGPRQLADVLSAPASQGRLLLHSFHPDEQALFARLGIDGALPAVNGDFLAVSESDRGANKIGSFVTRSTSARVTVDPGTGVVQSTVRVTLRNDAPASGLPDIVIGSTRGEPPGTYGVVLSVMTPYALDDATLDGAPVAIGANSEYGRMTYSASLSIPSGASQTLELHLRGVLPAGEPYRLTVVPRSTVRTERVDVTVEGAAGWTIRRATGMLVANGRATASEELFTQSDYSIVFVGP